MSVMYLSVSVGTTMEINACTFCVIPIFNVSLYLYIMYICTMLLRCKTFCCSHPALTTVASESVAKIL